MAIEDPKPRRAETTSDAKFEKIKDASSQARKARDEKEELSPEDPPTRGEESDDVRTAGKRGSEEQKPVSLGIDGNAVVLRGTLPNGSPFEKRMELPLEILSYFQSLRTVLPIVLDFTPLSPLIRVKAVSPMKDAIEMSPSKEFNIATGISTNEPIALSGRERGKNLRKEFKLDEFDRGTETALIHVPSNVFLVSAPFLAGLFGDSVRSMGLAKFRERYQFDNNESLRPLIDQGIEACLYSYNLGR